MSMNRRTFVATVAAVVATPLLPRARKGYTSVVTGPDGTVYTFYHTSHGLYKQTAGKSGLKKVSDLDFTLGGAPVRG